MSESTSIGWRGNKRIGILLLGVVLLGLVFFSIANPVAAHAFLSQSDPSNGAQLESLPDTVTLQYSGDGVVIADVIVIGPDGEPISGEPTIDPDDSQIVTVPLSGESEDGIYIVEWEILADDGHTTRGSFFFSVGEGPVDRDTVLATYEDGEAESIPGISMGFKALFLIGLIGLLGISVTGRVVILPLTDGLNETISQAITTRLQSLLGISAFAALIGITGLGIVREYHVILSESLGVIWIIQLTIGILLLCILGAATLRDSLHRFLWLRSSFIGSSLLIATVGWTSHSATSIGRLQGTIIDFVHISGAGLWIGGLAVLSVVIPVLHGNLSDTEGGRLSAQCIRRYSLLAILAVTAAGSTGLILASWHVQTATGLVETVYGAALSWKTIFVLVALGLGGFTRFWLLRQLPPATNDNPQDAESSPSVLRSPFSGIAEILPDTPVLQTVRRTIHLELLVLIGVIVLSGLLTSIATPAVAGDDEIDGITIERDFADDITVEVTVLSESVGGGSDLLIVDENEPLLFEVRFIDGDDLIESTDTVRLLAVHDDGTEIDRELERTDKSVYAGVQPLPAGGDWELRVTGFPDDTFGSAWITVFATPDGDEAISATEHDHGPTEGPFVVVMQFAAISVGIIGIAAILIEGVQYRRSSARN